MSEGDLRFPPARRREPAKFEPPPWEREQFEELAKSRVEQEPATAPAVGSPLAAPAPSVAEQVLEAVQEAEDAESAGADSADVGEAQTARPGIDPKRLEVMLMGLRAEEPRPEEAYWKVTTIAGGVSALIGFVITTWAIVAFATLWKSGPQGMTLASVLLVFGLGFVGGGIWLVARTLRQQGVL